MEAVEEITWPQNWFQQHDLQLIPLGGWKRGCVQRLTHRIPIVFQFL